MRFMNEYDIENALRTYGSEISGGEATPNRAHLAAVVARLARWADRNSDGWAYWPKPCRAALKAIELIDARTWQERSDFLAKDATDLEVTIALRPIKSFLTRHGVSADDRATILGRSA